MPLVGPDGEPLSTSPAPETQDQAPDDPPAPERVTTAFLILIHPNGRVTADDDLTKAFIPMRKPSYDDIIGAAANVQAELLARKAADMAAATTIQTQLAMQRKLQEDAVNAQIRQAVQNGPKG